MTDPIDPIDTVTPEEPLLDEADVDEETELDTVSTTTKIAIAATLVAAGYGVKTAYSKTKPRVKSLLAKVKAKKETTEEAPVEPPTEPDPES
jgi:hypothetical protein